MIKLKKLAINSLYVMLMVAAGAGTAVAETPKEQADRICHAFIEHPEDFKKIEATQSCKVPEVPGYFIRGDEKCFTHALDESAKQGKFAILNGIGSCSSASLVRLSEDDTGISAHRVEIKNANSDGYSFGSDDKALDYKGALFLTDQDNNDLRLVTDDGSFILCAVVYQLKGWEKAKSEESPICEKFLKGNYQTAEKARDYSPKSLKEDDALYDGEFDREEHVGSINKVDLIGNGQKMSILGLQFSSGGGCGCEEQSMSIAKSDKSTPEAQKLDKAVVNLTGAVKCSDGITWKVVTINGKGYIAQDSASDFSRFSRTPFLDRVLYEYKNGEFSEICRLKPKVQRVLDRDVAPDDLQYVPVK
jgi:hypothetical protein